MPIQMLTMISLATCSGGHGSPHGGRLQCAQGGPTTIAVATLHTSHPPAGRAVGAGAGALAGAQGVAARRAVSAQVALQNYIVDFVRRQRGSSWRWMARITCGRRAADARRDRALAATGLRVLRLPASLVTANLAAALQAGPPSALRC